MKTRPAADSEPASDDTDSIDARQTGAGPGDPDASGRARRSRKRSAKERRRRGRKRGRRIQLDADGNERPPFLAEFPDDDQLAAVVRAFERGDYARVRADAERLAREGTTEKVRAAARELRRRIDPDPLVRVLLLGAFALLAFLVAWTYWSH